MSYLYQLLFGGGEMKVAPLQFYDNWLKVDSRSWQRYWVLNMMHKLTFVTGFFLINLITLSLSGAAFAENFGVSGGTGMNGFAGLKGADGQSFVLEATGQSAILDLSGKDGGNGSAGQNGSSALGCFQNTGAFDEIGADGGNGGNGGDGGRGGNAGSLVVYYTDPSALKNLMVLAVPGKGGRAGSAGYGSSGCSCSNSFWTVNGAPYRCTNGREGWNGHEGFAGSAGQSGLLDLVAGLHHLAPTSPVTTVAVSALNPSTTVSLSENIWTPHSGAFALFAPGSQIADEYNTFDRRIDQSVEIEWNALRPATEFKDRSLIVALADGGRVDLVGQDTDFWIGVRQTEASPDHTHFSIDQALFASDAQKLSIGRFSGSGESLVLELDDTAQVSSFVATQIELRYETKSFLTYATRFEGEVPAELVTSEAGKVKIALGKLPLAYKYTAHGNKLNLQLNLVRSWNGYSLPFKLTGKFSI